MIRSERIGPAHTEPEISRARAAAGRDRLTEELAAAEAKFKRQKRTGAATRSRIQQLREELNEDL